MPIGPADGAALARRPVENTAPDGAVGRDGDWDSSTVGDLHFGSYSL